MCVCTPELKTPWCGAPGCETPISAISAEAARDIELEAAGWTPASWCVVMRQEERDVPIVLLLEGGALHLSRMGKFGERRIGGRVIAWAKLPDIPQSAFGAANG